jgi:hypothetical protein
MTLIHNATRKRPVYTENAINEQVIDSYTEEEIRCRVIHDRRTRWDHQLGKIVEDRFMLVAEYGTDIELGDIVTDIEARSSGDTVYSFDFEVSSGPETRRVGRGDEHHIKCDLERVS